MNLGQFHDQLRDTLKRGTSLDSLIPMFTRMAAAFLERNYTFLYMERFVETQVPAGDKYITLPSFRVRKIGFMRWRDSDNQFDYLKPINPADQSAWGSSVDTERPSGYWRDGAVGIVLAASHEVDLTAELKLVEMTAWPTNPSAVHWLLEVADDVLLSQAMMQAAVHLRDPDLAAFYSGFRDIGIKTLVDMDIEDRYSGESPAMTYSPET